MGDKGLLSLFAESLRDGWRAAAPPLPGPTVGRGILSNWFLSERDRDLKELRAQYVRAHDAHNQSPLASEDNLFRTAGLVLQDACERAEFELTDLIIEAVGPSVCDLLEEEFFSFPEIEDEERWRTFSLEQRVGLRGYLSRRERLLANFDRRFNAGCRKLAITVAGNFCHLSESTFNGECAGQTLTLEARLVDLMETPAEAIESTIGTLVDKEMCDLELFHDLQEQWEFNVRVASGLEWWKPHPPEKYVMPLAARNVSPPDLVEKYLANTPFQAFFEAELPLSIPNETRFEHCHIIGGTGHGKTQFMQRLIHADLVAASEDGRSVVVIDSQGDLINKLLRLELFSPDAPKSLANRLVLVDPSDVEFPAALNLFDAHLDRTESYSAVDRERVLNGVVELYETFFGAMLGAELTQKQGVIFRYLARLMITIPGATIHTLMEIMEEGAPYRPYMDLLEGSARHFFATEFFAPSFSATKKQILRRLWGVLSTPAFERMFSQPENKLDLYAAMNEGKIILVSTAKDLLKQDGSALLGRFFVAMIAQAALERSVIPADRRTPTFVYIDEAQEYFDDNIETILNQARKYRVGLTLAHQTLDQLSPRLRSALHANTSLKFAGGVSAKDARGLAEELRTTGDFIEGMRRRRDRTEFAAWIKNTTPSAIRFAVPLGHLERQPTSTIEALEGLLARNRTRYCGTRTDVASLSFTSVAPAPPTPGQPAAAEMPVSNAERVPLADPPATITEHVVEVSEEKPLPLHPSVSLKERELGKGGKRHRYLQALVRELGQQQGFRATVEAPIPGGQVDVLLERQDVRVAFEVSVTTPTAQEEANLKKCLDAGFEHVALLMVKSQKVGARLRETLAAGLTPAQQARVTFLTAEELPDYIMGLANAPAPAESVVKGYHVTVRRAAGTTPQEAKARRDAIAKVVARSILKNPE